ncbi:C6 zinc finger domain protein [Aspergillus steynii IBT 23096]|uniref:C6 zinc finger domain protein n=1 Tax=Aspergillus steynii IBT 23096 TaxID=1392250 RepID=A0A2I2GAC2_9EURO|nr:C6 zinc finger domain protein [Aspergillus steynii IBT 23096]PLB49813.1 C6 zinc finger domain protein [Aspergillus steynii IBT 23096]
MPLRRSHKKSHHGCLQCKQRRIKCDEARPYCGPCHRKQLACAFQSLLHQWHVATALSLAHEEQLADVVRVAVPREALAYPFLMHSVLAVSALHLSYTGPSERCQSYKEAAIRHNNLSLTLCTPLLSNVTPENCHALFAFSCLTAVFAFGVQGREGLPSAQGLVDVVEVFKMVRGVASVVQQARAWIEQGGMSQLLKIGKLRKRAAGTIYDRELCSHLETFIEEQLRPREPCMHQTINNNNVNAVLLQSANRLLHVLNMYMTMEDPNAILAWPVLLDAQYLDLLLQVEPTALIILAYYGTALHLLFDNWWLDGWGQFIMNLASMRRGSVGDWRISWLVDIIQRDKEFRLRSV